MPTFTRSSGSWRSVQTIYSKTETSWNRIAAGWVHDGTDWRQFFISGLRDHFNKTAGALGRTSDDKQQWAVTRGEWSISNNQARSTSSASTYPIASVNVGNSLAIVEADVPSPGSGVAFGIVDANNWWGAYISRRGFSYNCNPYPCNGRCASFGCGTCTICEPQPEVCECGTCIVCSAYKKYESYRNDNYRCTNSGWVWEYGNTYQCAVCNCTGFTKPTCTPSIYGTISSERTCLGTRGCPEVEACGCIQEESFESCLFCGAGCYTPPCVNTTYFNNCGKCGSVCTSFVYDTCYDTCTDSYYSLRLIRSVNGEVSEVGMVEGVGNGPALQSIRVESAATGITATAFTNTGLSGESLEVSSGLLAIGTRHGLLVAPSPLTQGNSVDNFYAEETE